MWLNNTVFTKVDSTLKFLCEFDPHLCFQQLFLTIGFFIVCLVIMLSPCLIKGIIMLIWHMCKRTIAALYNLICYNVVDTNGD